MTQNRIALVMAGILLSNLAACSNPPSPPVGQSTVTPAATTPKDQKVLTIGAIPDQEPEKLQRLYGDLASYLSKELGVQVVYKPVIDYPAAVTAFKVGDLDLVWFGGLTGVQARLQVPGAEVVAQRNVDEKFTSVFIANRSANIPAFQDVAGLAALKGKNFTFGSETSTSGRLMPQHFLGQAGVKLEDFKGGQPGFSKNHDATIELVTAGTYEAGVLSKKVWAKNLADGKIAADKVEVLFETPTYFDYHWVMNPGVKERFGPEFGAKVKAAFLKLDPAVVEQKAILDLFTAEKFIETKNENYATIEEIGREIGKIK
jgi:phosphonate transport system substrate-binding protein